MSTLEDQLIRNVVPVVLGDVIYHFPLLDSTNAYALKLLSQIRPKPGTVITTDYQTAGRGQFDNAWLSAPGLNLCLSVILYPSISPQEQFRISMAIALGVYDTVFEMLPDQPVMVKWPNDIYVGDKKIAGILIQNSIQGNMITSCVAGIGLNVNETDFPADLPNPTSLKLETGITHDVNLLRTSLLKYLRPRFEQLSSRSVDHLTASYLDVLYHRNHPARFLITKTGVESKGIISHVDNQGRLVIQWEDGKTEAYQHREIELLVR